ncbi:MAG: hypothetical protein FJZ90_02960 [Chloroflexi bacterium]|nr:hypothetical protein [Chloroflexota bacterium]
MATSELDKGFFKKTRRQRDQEPTESKPNPRSVRPDSFEELENWQKVARMWGVSLHSLMLFLIRHGIAELESGALEIEKEPAGEKIKMPK